MGLFSNLQTSRVEAAARQKANLSGNPLQVYNSLDVVINEVAWSGTVSDSSGEWIELYNPGPTKITLTDWTLVADDGVPTIHLTGEISPGGYFLLERTDDLTISDITADQIYVGDLGNTNETLRLLAPNPLDPNGTLIDSANLNGGAWPAGIAFPDYASMERIAVVPDSDAAWESNNGITKNGSDINGVAIRGTPRQPNSQNTPIGTTPPSATDVTPGPTNIPTRTKTPTPTIAPPKKLVISQFRTRGPNGANDEFVELFNPSNAPVNIGNWQIKKSSDCGQVITSLLTIPAGEVLLSGQHYLAASKTANLAGADQVFLLPIMDGGGLALEKPDDSIVDQVGLCAGTIFLEGTALQPLIGDFNQSYARQPNTGVRGCIDRNRNSEDFYPLSPSQPQGKKDPISMCPGVKTATPTIVTPIGTPAEGVGILVINEFLPHPGSDWNGDGAVNVGDEFIEIINIGTGEASMGGWKLDDSDGGSDPYNLPDITLLPGEIEVFYGKETGLILNDIGDSVRLMKPNSKPVETFSYPTVVDTDKSWCRIPDGVGAWKTGCLPSPDQPNKWEGTLAETPVPGKEPQARGQGDMRCPFAETLFVNVFPTRCSGWGVDLWNRSFWKADGYFLLPGLDKWGVILH